MMESQMLLRPSHIHLYTFILGFLLQRKQIKLANCIGLAAREIPAVMSNPAAHCRRTCLDCILGSRCSLRVVHTNFQFDLSEASSWPV